MRKSCIVWRVIQTYKSNFKKFKLQFFYGFKFIFIQSIYYGFNFNTNRICFNRLYYFNVFIRHLETDKIDFIICANVNLSRSASHSLMPSQSLNDLAFINCEKQKSMFSVTMRVLALHLTYQDARVLFRSNLFCVLTATDAFTNSFTQSRVYPVVHADPRRVAINHNQRP